MEQPARIHIWAGFLPGDKSIRLKTMQHSKTEVAKRADSQAAKVNINPHLRHVIQSFRRTLKGIFVFSFVINLLMLSVPLYLVQIFDKVIPNHSIDTLYFLTGIVLIALTALGFLEAVRRRVLAKLGAWFENQLGEHLLSSAILRAIKKSRPSINVLHDLTRLRKFLAGSALLPILDMPWAPVYIIVLYLLHPLIGLLVLLGALLLVALAVVNQRITRDIVRNSDVDSREVLDSATSYVRNAEVIQAMGMQRTVLQRWSAQHTKSLAQSHTTNEVTAKLASLAKFAKLLLQIGTICLAAWLILQGQLSAGSLIACVLLLRRAVSPLEQAIGSWESVLNAKSSFERINEYLDHAPTLEETQPMPEPHGALAVEQVRFRRSGEKNSVLSSISLLAKAGDIIAIIGDTAAGKSTLAKILVGILAPNSGRVTLGGFDLKHWAAEDLGRHVGYLPQDVELFTGTIRENIARLQEGDIDKVIEAAKLRPEAEVKKAVAAYEAGFAKADILAPFRDTANGGDPAAGERLFREHPAAQCVRCHRVGGEGSDFGPDLAKVATRLNGDQLLESLINPSAQIAEGFALVTIETKGGETIGGTLRSETKQGLVVVLPDGSSKSIPSADIKEKSTAAVSTMPPMSAILQKMEIRDVLAYLRPLK